MKMFSYGLRKTNVRKDLRLIHERLKMGSYAADVFSAMLPRMRILKLNTNSRAPGFESIHAPPAPYKGTQLKRRVHNRQIPQATRKQLSVGKTYGQRMCIKTGCRHFNPVSGWIKLFNRNGQGPLLFS